MTLMVELERARDCMEGILPAVIATCDSNGLPNVTYLSKVVFVDREHVALSNQFFSKTAANLEQNAQAQITLLNPKTGRQLRLDASLVRSETSGELFEQLRAEIDAIASIMHMEAVFKLRRVDVFRVVRAEFVASDADPTP